MVGRWTFLLRLPWGGISEQFLGVIFFGQRWPTCLLLKKPIPPVGKRGGHEMFFLPVPLLLVFVAAIFFRLKILMLQKLNLQKNSPPRHEEVGCIKGDHVNWEVLWLCFCLFVCSIHSCVWMQNAYGACDIHVYIQFLFICGSMCKNTWFGDMIYSRIVSCSLYFFDLYNEYVYLL